MFAIIKVMIFEERKPNRGCLGELVGIQNRTILLTRNVAETAAAAAYCWVAQALLVILKIHIETGKENN